MAWFTPKHNCGCKCGCQSTCSDSSTRKVNQLAYELDDLNAAFRMYYVNLVGGGGIGGDPGKDEYVMLYLNLVSLNGTYVVAKQEDCTWGTTPQASYTFNDIAYTKERYDAVSGTECPTTVLETGSGTCTVTLEFHAGEETRRIIIKTIIDGRNLSEGFAPQDTVDPCAVMVLKCDTNIYRGAFSEVNCTGDAYGGGLYYATTTPGT